MSWVLFYDLLQSLGSNLFLEDVKILCVENDDLVIFRDYENFIFFYELAKCNNSLVNLKRIRFNPFALYDNFPSYVFFDLPESQEVDFGSESISQNEFFAADKSWRGFNFSFTPRNRINSDIRVAPDMVDGNKVIHGESEVVDFQNVHNVDSADTNQAAIFIVHILPEIKFEKCWDFGYLGYWIVQWPDHLLCKLYGEGGEHAFLNAMNEYFSALAR